MKKYSHVSGDYSPNSKLSKVTRFTKDENGSFTIFVLIGFLMFLAVFGMGADIMKFERNRANLQSTLDRAVLAAADLDQKEPPQEVVESYLEKAGLKEYLKKVQVTDAFGSRKVYAEASAVVPMHFIYWFGIADIAANATSEAEEAIGSVEISLVLDISGSMSDPSATDGKSKIAVLRESATEFVEMMLDKDGDNKVSISLVPYATQVSAGDSILSKFPNASSEHAYSHCVNFSSSDFSSTQLPRSSTLKRTAHFDRWYYAEGSLRLPECPVRAGSAITPLTDNYDKLSSEIALLTPGGNTSIDIGMKWGMALLDPSMRSVVKDLSNETDPNYGPAKIVPSSFDNRPLDYDADTLKVLIVMTDGKNTSQAFLDPSLRQGNSDVWYNPEADEYSVYSHYYGRYYWQSRNQWGDYPYGNPPNENVFNNQPGTASRLTYPQLFNRASLKWNAYYNYGWQSNYWSRWVTNAYTTVGTYTKNLRTNAACSAAKNNGVIVYGIAFEAPPEGYTVLKNCASSDSHLYNVDKNAPDGLDLNKAFVSIASSIRKLRLTQ